ncbi:MAG: DUF1178 family protein [Alkalilacustris sp.]
MIRYSLRCPNGHGFDSWFGSAGDYDRLTAAGQIACPDCGAGNVAKAPMAPSVRPGRNAAAPPPAPGPALSPDEARRAALAELRRRIEASSENVGLRFAAEARAMHAGEAPERPIHGEARPDEARALIEEGVPVLPLPFLPSRKVN